VTSPGDFRRTAQAKVAGNGSAVAVFPALDADTSWNVTRLVVSCTGSGTQPVCVIHVVSGGQPPSQASQFSGTNSGFFDEADYAGALIVGPSEQLIAVWTGAPPGETALVSAQLDTSGD
jgi:hypothetical protein